MNNGFASETFPVERDVRQGDPLSPAYLFIIALDILNIAIRQNKDIEGIQVGESIIKLSVSADGLTTFEKKNGKSIRLLQKLLQTFGDISGLRLNKEKKQRRTGSVACFILAKMSV